MSHGKGSAGLTARGTWYLQPRNTPSKAIMMELGYLLSEPLKLMADTGLESSLYPASAEIVERAKVAQISIKYHAYWQSGPQAVLRYRPHQSRKK